MNLFNINTKPVEYINLSNDPIYYVYIFFDPRKPKNLIIENIEFNYEPFYIGKGKKSRITRHLKENKKSHNELKYNILNSIKSEGLEPIIIKIKENLTEIEALKLEEKLINQFGRRIDGGILTNIVLGNYNIYRIKNSAPKKVSTKKISQYDINGLFLCNFNSIKEASQKLNIGRSLISQSCRKEIKVVKNKWVFYYKDDFFNDKEIIKDKKHYSIMRIDYNGNIKKYNSALDAKKEGFNNVKIGECCKGKILHSQGYIWRYSDIDLNNKYIKNRFLIILKYKKFINKKIICKKSNIIYENLLHALFFNNLMTNLLNKKLFELI